MAKKKWSVCSSTKDAILRLKTSKIFQTHTFCGLRNGYTALMIAAEIGNVEMANLFIDRGCDIEAKNK